MHGLSVSAEREKAAAALRLEGGQRVLDVACGPGDFTSFFAEQADRRRVRHRCRRLGADAAARRERQQPRPRGLHACRHPGLPFDDGAFDAVCCFGALHLMPEPLGVLREMVRVLAPLGRIAVLTSYGRESSLARKALALGRDDLRRAGFRPHDGSGVLRGGRSDRYRPAAAWRLPVRHGMQAGTCSRA